MADITTYTIILKDSGVKAFTMPGGFWEDIEIHCWGAGGGTGRGGAKGGGGGYAKTTVNVYEGDEVSLQIGQPGRNANSTTGGLGGLDPTYRVFRGGNGGNSYDEDADSGASGGGGGASWVAVNENYVCVGAGGGGASGYGEDGGGAPGNYGLPGGSYVSLNTVSRGADAYGAGSPAGGSGAGYPYGGGPTTGYGDDYYGAAAGGNGGQNYGNLTVAGSGILPGGTTVSYYPSNHVGEAGYAGYIAIILRKKLNVSIKDAKGDGTWANVAAAYVKVPATTISTEAGPVTKVTAGWKQIQAAWTKVDNKWKPILTDKGINLYNYPVKRKKANITISVDTSDYNLYDNMPIAYFEGLMDIDVWVFANVEITGNATSTAFTVSNFTTGDNIILHNHGYIQGKGGSGGSRGYRYTQNKSTYTAPPTAGGDGGTGLLLNYPITLLNDGTIAGGGGGGGGGAEYAVTSGKNTTYYAGGQGGGGGGFGVGYNNGTITTGGAGENVSGSGGIGDGGAGGARGQAGVAGNGSYNNSYLYGGAAGGKAGYAIQGTTNLISGSNTGAYYGPLAG